MKQRSTFYSWIFLLCTLLLSSVAQAQQQTYAVNPLNRYLNPNFIGVLDTSIVRKYPFIHFERNHYRFFTEDSPNFHFLYYKIQQMVRYHDRKLNFYHIGGSHIQADIYSNDMREFLQTNWANLPGERGWVFPFRLAGTNNPWNYSITSSNKWQGHRSVIDKTHTVNYGLLGMAISCGDSIINLKFSYSHTNVTPPIDHIRVYHNKGELDYSVHYLPEDTTVHVKRQETNEEHGYTDFYLDGEVQKFEVEFIKLPADSLPAMRTNSDLFIYGFHLSNNRPGISYTSIGVNGAGLYTYLANDNFEEQLKDFPPDVFIFSVGTNDANVPYADFHPEYYKHNLETMMQKVYAANPNCAILLTVPNDAYYYRRYPNKNVARERTVIIELAKKYRIPVWDMYGLMGELGSSKTWKINGLMRSDYVHFTVEGYHLKGKLFIASFLKWMEQMQLYQIAFIDRYLR